MTIVTKARSALQNGASTVLSSTQRRSKAKRQLPRRLMALTPQTLVQRVSRRFGPRRARRSSLILPITLAAGATVVSLMISIILSRYLTARRAAEYAAEHEEHTEHEEESIVVA
jgi:hypothetical protein